MPCSVHNTRNPFNSVQVKKHHVMEMVSHTKVSGLLSNLATRSGYLVIVIIIIYIYTG